MSDTPETDQAQFGTGRVSVDFARRLERERNEARSAIAKTETNAKTSEVVASDSVFHPGEPVEAVPAAFARRLESERNEAREIAEQLRAWKTEQLRQHGQGLTPDPLPWKD